MSLSTIWRIVLRRWYVALAGLLITIGLAAGGAVLSPPTYEAHATILLLPPKSNQQLNPYLNLGGMQEPSDVISRALSDTETSDAIAAAGGSGKYSIARDTSTSGPIILITADATSGPQALRTAQLLIDRVGPEFDKLQAQQNVPASAYIKVLTLGKDQQAKVQRKSQLRAIIAAVAVGIVLTILLVGYTERRFARRARRAETPAPGAEEAPATDPEPTAAEPAGPGAGQRHNQRGSRRRRNNPRSPAKRSADRPAPDDDPSLIADLTGEHDDAPSRR